MVLKHSIGHPVAKAVNLTMAWGNSTRYISTHRHVEDTYHMYLFALVMKEDVCVWQSAAEKPFLFLLIREVSNIN